MGTGNSSTYRAVLLPTVVLALVALAGRAVPALASEDPVPGHVIFARASQDALLLWDATVEVTAIVRERRPDGAANARLEHDALRVLAASLSEVKHARTITVRVIYSKTGDVSPVYGAPTFLGIERYANVTLAAASAAANRDGWQQLDAKSVPPGWIAFKIVGALPPR